MIISVSHVKKSKRQHRCNICDKFIPVGSRLVDMYGAGEYGDRPYHIKFHHDCFINSPSKDVIKHMKNCDICNALNGGNS